MSINGDFVINDELLNELLENEENKNSKDYSTKDISFNSNKIEKNDDKKCFKNFNFYVEIYNNTIDQSDLLDEIIKSNGGKVVKKLQKDIDFIIFKEGKNKTVEFSLDKNIKLVNPLFIHESALKGELQPWEYFEIKKSYSEIFRNSINNSITSSNSVQTIYTKNESDNKKKKFDQAFPELKTQNEDNISKKKFQNNLNISSIKLTNNKELNENTKFDSEAKKNNLQNDEKKLSENKITNFFRPSTKSEIKSNPEIKNLLPDNQFLDSNKTVEKSDISLNNTKSVLIKISSISIGEEGKFKINSCVKSLGKYIYIGESLENIAQSDIVVVNEIYNKNDIKFIYCLFHDKKIISLKFFTDSKKENQYKFNLEDLIFLNESSNVNEEEKEKIKHNFYLKDFSINFKFFEEKKIIKDYPFKEDRYKIYLHPSIYQKELIKKELYVKLLELLGLDIENNIRLSDICIINKEDLNEHFPGHLRLINESFLFDCLFNWKVMNLENMKYFPEKIKIKK